jgi:hypothetical protein
VALAAVKGEKPLAELAEQFDVQLVPLAPLFAGAAKVLVQSSSAATFVPPDVLVDHNRLV